MEKRKNRVVNRRNVWVSESRLRCMRNEDVLVSRLFYVIPDIFEVKLRVFIFYEENTFLKTKGDDLKLIHSELKIQ